MGAATMSTFDVVIRPGASGGFRLRVACAPRWISAGGSLTFGLRFHVAVAWRVGLCNERASLRFIKFNVAADFPILKFTKDVAN
eukprot:418380-Pleurochrysis_carterae.AAC.1